MDTIEAHNAPDSDQAPPAPRSVWTTPLAMAALASAGAGLVHAAASGTHNSDRAVALVFGAMAAVHLAWAGGALLRPRRDVAVGGMVVNGVALAAWALSRTRGLPVLDGFAGQAEVGTQDVLGAVLAGLAVLGAGVSLSSPRTAKAPNLLAGSMAGVLVLALAIPAMAAPHEHGAAGHGAGDTAVHGHAGTAPGDVVGMAGVDHHRAVVAVPYDPAKPIDLGGRPGVTPEQQAEAENLVSVTLVGLPQWSDPEYALANGFHTIGDGFTGTEHFINDDFMNDDVILDPDKPESLVWDVSGGKRTLAAAMYMEKPGTELADVPTIGGDLVQWHVHSNLCYNPEGLVRGVTDGAGNCPIGLVKPAETPMVHVWIRKHGCGPFAALEGIGGGDILPGQERLCDEAHGAEHQ